MAIARQIARMNKDLRDRCVALADENRVLKQQAREIQEAVYAATGIHSGSLVADVTSVIRVWQDTVSVASTKVGWRHHRTMWGDRRVR